MDRFQSVKLVNIKVTIIHLILNTSYQYARLENGLKYTLLSDLIFIINHYPAGTESE